MKLHLGLLGIILCILLAGCKNVGTRDTVEDSSVDNLEKEVVISFAHKSVNSYFYTIMNESVKRAVEAKGWIFENSVADYDALRQSQQIVNAIKKSPDAIITTAIDSIAIEEVVNRANEAGVPFCTIDTSAVGGEIAVDVSFDNFKAGEMAAEEIIEGLIEKYGTPKGVVFNAYGELTSNAWRLRKEGFESVIEQYPDIDYIAKSTRGQPGLVKEALLEVLDSGVAVDAVHASSEHPGRGLVEALQLRGMWYPFWEEAHVILVTIDAEPYFVNLINKGYADSAISQDVIAYGDITIDLLANYVFGEDEMIVGSYYSENTYWRVSEISLNEDQIKVTIPPYVVDATNSSDHRHWAYKAEKLWGFQYNK